MRKILIPYDFSVPSELALHMACDLARTYQAEVTLFHVYNPPTYPLPLEGAMMPSAQQLADHMTAIISALAGVKRTVEQAGVTKVQTHVVQGEPFVEIIREAREGGYDLIAMATHGRTGLKHALIGSVAEKIVRKAPCAVLTLRPPTHRFEHP